MLMSACAALFASCGSDLGDHQPVAVLMHASAELLAQLPAIGPQHMKQQRLAYLMAAAAALGESASREQCRTFQLPARDVTECMIASLAGLPAWRQNLQALPAADPRHHTNHPCSQQLSLPLLSCLLCLCGTQLQRYTTPSPATLPA